MKPRGEDGSGNFPHQPPPPPPPPPSGNPEEIRKARIALSARAFLDAVAAWQEGNVDFVHQRYDSAAEAYDRCQQAVLQYFAIYPDYFIQTSGSSIAENVDQLVANLAQANSFWTGLASAVTWRRQLLSLVELGALDWTQLGPTSTGYLLLKGNLLGQEQPAWLPGSGAGPIDPQFRKDALDARLLVLATVLCPLARAEANRLRRQYAAALADLDYAIKIRTVTIANTNPPQTRDVWFTCDFIERPFAQLLKAETLLDAANAQYKSRASVDDEPETDDAAKAKKAADLKRLNDLAAIYMQRQLPSGSAQAPVVAFQHLAAALSYQDAMDVFRNEGAYISRTNDGVDALTRTVRDSDPSSAAFQSAGLTLTIPTVGSVDGGLPGFARTADPHASYVKFSLPQGQTAMREQNPRVYAVLLEAQARLLQIWSGCNYLGYRDDYVPPWRFSYLLDRARYFSEHAKNAQRDYLNFLNNAENEELKEMSAGQNVELEKANVQIESAKVLETQQRLVSAKQSSDLANLEFRDSQAKASAYATLDDRITNLQQSSSIWSDLGAVASVAAGVVLAPETGGASLALGLGLASAVAGAAARRDQDNIGQLQRGFELDNLTLAVNEARQRAQIAQQGIAIAATDLLVAGLQRQATLLRHQFALQNLQFMRSQTLNTEQWYRMAGAIRSVGDSYLRYAIQTAFLAQQAYNFESDRRVSVIRFDYDLSGVGAMLAADFLLRDLDTLEQDLVASQQTRLQQVRFVLSMAREFPETLRTLGETGEVTLSMRLEQLERHFPGLVNLRISGVDLLPIALMDPTRFSVGLTHLGTGMIRLRSQPGESPLNSTDLSASGDWLPNASPSWPVKVHVSGPETEVFTGLSHQEAASASAITANERRAFEGLPGASSWKIEMSIKENRVVPGTLADVLITFTLSGYYDPALKEAVTAAAATPRRFETTSVISAARVLPDSYYSLAKNGALNWNVSRDMLGLGGTPGVLHNLAIILALAQDGVDLGRCSCRYPIEIEITSAGQVKPITSLPAFTLTPNKLTLACAYIGAAGASVSWDFGDGSALAQGANAQHLYRQPGRYEVLVRLVQNGRLDEYRSAVYVSQNQAVTPPLIVSPSFAYSGTSLTVSTGSPTLGVDCAIGKSRAKGASGLATLSGIAKGAKYKMTFAATRQLSAHFYGRQRYLPAVEVKLDRMRASTNRTFDAAGVENTTAPNAFTMQVFDRQVLAPDDRWTLELPMDKNPWFLGVSSSDMAQFDGEELADAVISLEYPVE